MRALYLHMHVFKQVLNFCRLFWGQMKTEVKVSVHSSLYCFFWHDAFLLNLLFILLFFFFRSRICRENFTAARNLSAMSLF